MMIVLILIRLSHDRDTSELAQSLPALASSDGETCAYYDGSLFHKDKRELEVPLFISFTI